MRKLTLAALALTAGLLFARGAAAGGLRINEIVPDNRFACTSATGGAYGYVELYNAGERAVALDGLRLGAGTDARAAWPLPGGLLAPGEYLLVYASGFDRTYEGERHASFVLDKAGGSVTLFGAGGALDYAIYGALETDTALCYDERRGFAQSFTPTPGAENLLHDRAQAAAYALSRNAAGVIINECMAINGLYEDGRSEDWLELRNLRGEAVDLTGYYLSDDEYDPLRFAIPQGVTIGASGYLTVYCTGGEAACRDGALYAPFKLAGAGGVLTLCDPAGQVVDRLVYGQQYVNVSFGRAGDGGPAGYLAHETRGAANAQDAYARRAAAPVLSLPFGVYSGTVAVTAAAPGAVVRYTTDGSEPTAGSPVLDALSFTATAALRVRAFQEGALPSEIVSGTYFVNETMPAAVVSLITDDAYLYGENGAITHYGRELEYPVHIEYIDEGGARLIAQTGTFRIFGGTSRQLSQKSFALFARKAYGAETFAFNPFPYREYTQYKSLVLRNGGSDAKGTRIRDEVFAELAMGLHCQAQDSRLIEVYLNGKYYGHYMLREKINKHAIAQWEGVTDEDEIDAIDILKGSGYTVQNGSNEDYLSLMDFCKTQDLNLPENLDYVLSRMDVASYFDHTIFEIIIGNGDIGNTRVYRVPGGKWKWVLYDTEAGFLNLNTKPLELYTLPIGVKNGYFQHAPLMALLRVPQMRDQFFTRFAQILGTVFLRENIEAVIDKWAGALEPLLPRHIDRWGRFTLREWRNNVSAIRYNGRVRALRMPAYVREGFGLTDEEFERYFGAVQKLLEEHNRSR